MITIVPGMFDNDLKTLSDELEKGLRLVNSAITPSELNVAEQYINAFVIKWKLSTPKHINPIIAGILNKIFTKRNEWVLEDLANAERTKLKIAA